MHRSRLFKKLTKSEGNSDPKMVCDTLSSQDVFTHQMWDTYLKKYKRYALDMIILKTRPGQVQDHSDL